MVAWREANRPRLRCRFIGQQEPVAMQPIFGLNKLGSLKLDSQSFKTRPLAAITRFDRLCDYPRNAGHVIYAGAVADVDRDTPTREVWSRTVVNELGSSFRRTDLAAHRREVGRHSVG